MKVLKKQYLKAIKCSLLKTSDIFFGVAACLVFAATDIILGVKGVKKNLPEVGGVPQKKIKRESRIYVTPYGSRAVRVC